MRAVDSDNNRHSIHSYYLTSPESPDGRWVLFFTLTSADGQKGEIRIRDRAHGEERLLAEKIVTEDAHRVACQQWLSGGKRVAYHTLRDGAWLVAAVELESGREQVLAKERLIGFGQPRADLLPIYGCHWKPGKHHDLEIVDVTTGKITVPVTAAAVKSQYADWIEKSFGDREISIFFPVLSPDLKRVFFKMSSPAGGAYNSTSASHREGLVSYDLAGARFFFSRTKWGHPSWSPDSQTILEVGNVLIDAATGKARRFAGRRPWEANILRSARMESCSSKTGRWNGLAARRASGASSWGGSTARVTSSCIGSNSWPGPDRGAFPTRTRYSVRTGSGSTSTSAGRSGRVCTWPRRIEISHNTVRATRTRRDSPCDASSRYCLWH